MAMPSRVRMRNEIGFELGKGSEDIEEHLAHRIARIVERPAEHQFHAPFPKLVGDDARIRDGPCQPVEFGHDQGVACAHGEGGEDIEEHLSHGIARVVERPAEHQFHAPFPKLVGDDARIRDGPCQPVEFGHDQGVACAHGGEGLVGRGSCR